MPSVFGFDAPIKGWSPTTLKEMAIKIGAKVVSHTRCVAFQMAEMAIPPDLFKDIRHMMAELRSPPSLRRREAFGCHAFRQDQQEKRDSQRKFIVSGQSSSGSGESPRPIHSAVVTAVLRPCQKAHCSATLSRTAGHAANSGSSRNKYGFALRWTVNRSGRWSRRVAQGEGKMSKWF